MTPSRAGRMDPSTFKDIMILAYNSDLWDAHLVQVILNEKKPERILVTPSSNSSGGSAVYIEDEADGKESN